MNKSSSSSSSSTPLQQRPTSSTSTRKTPSIIPLDYNYQTMSPSSLSHLRHESTAATSANTSTYHARSGRHNFPDVDVDIEVDHQYSSLFGDPVPPPPPSDFLATQFPTPQLFRPTSIDNSSEEDTFGQTVTLEHRRPHMRLFSDVPYSSSISRRLSSTPSTMRNFDVLPSSMPRLQPPDIQILPNSSGGSSSEHRTGDSPNYDLLTPDDILRRPALYDISEPGDMTELMETMTISDANGTREYSEATRRVSNFSEDFKSNVGSLSTHTQTVDLSAPLPPKTCARQCSNESYTSSEWFRPATHDFPEFSKMPKMRPSSKNVMSIKRDEMPMHHSPVAAMINDSNGSSSGGEERLLDTTQVLEHPTVSLDALAPARPPDPSPSLLREMETDLLLSPQQYLKQRRKSTVDGLGPNFPPPPLPAAPPPIPPAPILTEEDHEEWEESKSRKREMSPAIIRDSITTGGDYRVEQTRLHKKSSFTIISDKSPQSSRAQSPSMRKTPSHHIKDPTTTTSSSSAKPVAKPRYHLQRKSLTSIQLKLPQLTGISPNQMTADDSPRPSVQFNMTGRHSPSKMPQKGILQYRESLTSSQDTLPLTRQASNVSMRRRSSLLPTLSSLTNDQKMQSYETLPLITDPYRTSIPRLNRSSLDLRRESAIMPPGALPRPLKPNPNPTRKQRGLMRIINGEESSSRIPLRSNWASMDDLMVEKQRRPSLLPLDLQNRRRSSSTSPERRSSTLTASDRRSSNLSTVTSDFSFRRSSVTPQAKRRKSIMSPSVAESPKTKRRQSIVPPSSLGMGNRTPRTKIAKASTLSPIIGTPNKDSSTPQSPIYGAASLAASETTLSDTTSRRDSLSKIPVRNGNGINSRSNSRMSSQPGSRINSQPGSRANSRSNSPLKEFTAQLPLSGLTSRTSSRSPSRATVRTDSPNSRANSRAPSRSTSRASTRPISRGPPSRASTRPNSRMDQAKDMANSRSNSRMSVHSTGVGAGRSDSISPSMGRKRSQTPNRRESISLSPKFNRRPSTIAPVRRRSVSPANKARANNRGRAKKSKEPKEQRRNSRSRIPKRAPSGVGVGSGKSAPKSIPKLPPKPPVPTAGRKKIPPSPARPATKDGGVASQRKEPTANSAKKAPASVRKPESSVKRTPSSVGKQTTAAKKQPSNLQKTGSNLKREPSNLQKKGSAAAGGKSTVAKREASSISMKKVAAAGGAVTAIKRQPSSKDLQNKANGEAKTSATVKASEASPASAEVGESSASVSTKPGTTNANAAAVKAVGVLKRQPSTMSMMRIGSAMSLMRKKRSDGNSSKNIEEETAAGSSESTGKQSPHSKANVISMTTAAAITGQPVQISTAVTNQLTKMNSSGQLIGAGGDASILERSQKTLENIQKTVTDATDEIHKTINENLTDLKSMESDMGAASPTSSVATVVENKAAGGKAGASVSRGGTAEGPSSTVVKSTPTAATAGGGGAGPKGVGVSAGLIGNGPNGQPNKSPLPPTQPIEADVSVVNMDGVNAATESSERVSARAISVLPEVDCESENFQNYEFAIDDTNKTDRGVTNGVDTVIAGADGHVNAIGNNNISGEDFKDDTKRRSPDGQGVSVAGSGDKTDSQQFLEEKEPDENETSGCCRCCTKFCMPCRRSRCSRCCSRKSNQSKNDDESEQPVLSATSSATTTNLEVIDERQSTATSRAAATKSSCWQKLNCCKRCAKKKTADAEMIATAEQQTKMETIREEGTGTGSAPHHSALTQSPPKQSKCGLCLSKVFCCRSVNKIETTTGDETEVKKCCFCIPCRKKRGVGRGSAVGSVGGASSVAGSAAWEDPERGITATDAAVLEGVEAAPKQGCCKRFWSKLCCCCRKKAPVASQSRRASMKPPPSEDTRRKLHVDLVEYNSKMKGAIPVMPLCLAWFCAICNMVVPGLGTLLSGIFCLCVGIPRFSHYDSAKARVGSLIINIIVAVAQLFCVLFCFVGWGWSIWWGTIMIKCARKLSKIKKVERLEMEDERRQAEAATAAATVAATTVRAAPVAVVAVAPDPAPVTPEAESETAKT